MIYDPKVAHPEPPIGGVDKRPDPRIRNTSGAFTTKLSAEIISEIETALLAGGSMETAAAHSGISVSTFRQWLVDGRRAQNLPRPQPEDISRKVELVEAVDRGIADFKLSLTGGIYQHGRDSWQAWAWLAERRFPDEFGRRQRIEHANPDGEAFRVQPTPMLDLSKLDDEEIEMLIRLHEKGRPEGMRIPSPGDAPEELRVIEQ